jgi:hypothetical protein
VTKEIQTAGGKTKGLGLVEINVVPVLQETVCVLPSYQLAISSYGSRAQGAGRRRVHHSPSFIFLLHLLSILFLLLQSSVLFTIAMEGQGGPPSPLPHRHDGMVERIISQSPFRVLGIALVVDQVGKGTKMVLRYPTAPLTTGTEDLFFLLPARQMAKLFRPRSPLCGKPMTLMVGGTVFCCRAILMGDDTVVSSRSSDDAASDDGTSTAPASGNLLLFSVIVALAPQVQESSIPVTGWFEGHSYFTDFHPSQQQSHESGNATLSSSSRIRQASPSFLSIRRVHISLARLCRVLEREERRCKYVSVQTHRFRLIRNELNAKWEQARRVSDGTGVVASASATGASSAVSSPVSTTSKTPQAGSVGARSHRRNHSFSLYERSATETPSVSSKRANTSDNMKIQNTDNGKFQNTEEFQQEFLDTIMAAGSGGNDNDDLESDQGNLARELMQVYHALARNDSDFPPTTTALLSGRNGVVFINGHLTTAIEAVSPLTSLPCTNYMGDIKPVVLPYQTLLFPHTSAAELLESLTSSSSGPPRRLHQLLRAVHPQKPLTDVAIEATLPLQVTLDMACVMVEQGACVTASPLSRNSQLACRRMDLIPKVSLAFAQTFGDALDVFHLVAYLTKANRTLGNAVTAWKTSPDDQWLREKLEACPLSSVFANPVGEADGDENDGHLNVLEELLYQMTIWLYSHRVVIQLQEYLVATTTPPVGRFTIDEDASAEYDGTERKMDSNLRLDRLSDDLLYKELLASGCLEGKSLQACSWQTGIDPNRLRTFALQHPQMRLMVRAPDGIED